jgi:hypothetical protein
MPSLGAAFGGAGGFSALSAPSILGGGMTGAGMITSGLPAIGGSLLSTAGGLGVSSAFSGASSFISGLGGSPYSGIAESVGSFGKNILGAAAVAGAGAVAYKKSPQFKNAVDELKGKLGFNKTGGAVKKYRDGGPTDSLKVIKTEGKLAVKTEKQKQADAKKAAALAKKIAKAKENARLNLEWERMSEDEKDAIIRQQISRF